MPESLFIRLGGAENIQNIANSLVDNHLKNPLISTRFQKIDVDPTKLVVAQFISTGTGGPANYTGEDMLSVHKGMNISPGEFMAMLDDALDALTANGVGQPEQEEMLYILYSLRSEVVAV